MSEEPIVPTSPTLPASEGIVHSPKEFSDFLTQELTDDEIATAFQIVMTVSRKYATRLSTPENLEQLRDEVLTRLAEDVNVLASFDPTPTLQGEPPILEFIGKVKGDSIHKYGFDHERKTWEVRKANERNEDYLGQKERPLKRKR